MTKKWKIFRRKDSRTQRIGENAMKRTGKKLISSKITLVL